MNKIVGIFRVIKDNNNILGTAFAIKTIENNGVYYLLTAYHVIIELEARGCPIIIKDENDNSYCARRIFPNDFSKEYREFGQDYALLEMYADIEYKTYEIATINKRLECFVRGAALHYSTIFTSVDGKILGEEIIQGQKRVLQMSLKTKRVYDKNNKIIPEQEILQGLSGSPVLTDINGATVCVGVLGNLERDCSGSVVYAVPIKTILEDCLNKLNIAYRLCNEEEEGNAEEAFLESIFNDTEDFCFSDEELEWQVWNKLSNLFYRGIQVDVFLHNLIISDSFRYYNSEVKCAILYFYARLLFKRGKNRSAFIIFNDILGLYSEISTNSKEKLRALINSRIAIEGKIESPSETLNAIRCVGEEISNIHNASNDYISYELASLYGRGLTNLFSLNINYSTKDKENLCMIFNEHKYLLEKNPIKLRKQEVVNTSLQWYLGFWSVNKDFDLNVATINGFLQSKKRKNNIFYIQCMISYGMIYAIEGRIKQSIEILLLCVKLMHKEKVNLKHEGVKQLLLILKERFIALYAIVELAFNTKLGYQFVEKVSLYKIDFGTIIWNNIIDQVNVIYSSIYEKNKRIYDVDIEDIKFFL